jgi:hypothetical protein
MEEKVLAILILLFDRDMMDPKTWCLVDGARAPLLQKVALKLLA